MAVIRPGDHVTLHPAGTPTAYPPAAPAPVDFQIRMAEGGWAVFRASTFVAWVDRPADDLERWSPNGRRHLSVAAVTAIAETLGEAPGPWTATADGHVVDGEGNKVLAAGDSARHVVAVRAAADDLFSFVTQLREAWPAEPVGPLDLDIA